MDIDYQILFSLESLKVDERECTELDITEFVKLIPRKLAIQYGLAIANYSQDDDINVQLNSLQFNSETKRFVEFILASKEFNEKYILFKPQTGLEILKYTFSIPKEAFISGSTTFFPLLISIIIINSLLLSNDAHLKDNSITRSSKIIRSKSYELDERVPIFATVFRMCCLLHFLEQNCENQWTYLRDYLIKDISHETLRDYFKCVLELLNRLTIGPKNKFQILKVKEDNPILRNLIDPLSVSTDEVIRLEDNRDYTFFKKHPFIQLAPNNYGVISNLFVANQLYSSLKFRMSKISMENKIFKNFLSSFNKDFVENYLLNEVLGNAFGGKRDTLHLNENECVNRIKEYNKTHKCKISIEGLPDAYIRSNNKILLIECKGKTISLDAIENEAKFFNNVNNDIVSKNKGTGQLISYCNKVKKGEFVCDKGIPSEFVIYPFLIVDDPKLGIDGLNRYAIQCTEEYVQTNRKWVYPVTVLDLDTLILISDLIKKGEFDIFEQIEQYHMYIAGEAEKYSLNETLNYSDISFASYILDKFETRSPAIINQWLEGLYSIK